LVRQWAARCAIVLACIIAITAVGHLLHRPALSAWRAYKADPTRKALYQRCLSHAYPPGTIVFDEAADPQQVQSRPTGARTPPQRPRARTLAGTDRIPYIAALRGRWPAPRNLDVSSKWTTLASLNEQFWTHDFKCRSGMMPAKHFSMAPFSADEVFIHGRRAPGGEVRLVAVGFDPIAFMDGSDTPFCAFSMGYRGPLSSLHSLGWRVGEEFQFAVAPDKPLKLFAGHIDPADESHFTIDFDTGGTRRTIDGWLLPDDTVKLQLRE
jgi:hypothetical protein